MSEEFGHETRAERALFLEHTPEAAHGRLSVERRVLGLIAFSWVMAMLFAGLWIMLLFGDRLEASLLWGPLALQCVAITVVLAYTTIRMPVARWGRQNADTIKSPLALGLLGFPSLPAWPILAIRDRRALKRSMLPSAEVEQAFRQLLQVPAATAIAFGAGIALAVIASALWIGNAVEWPRDRTVGLAGLWTAATLPLSVLIYSRVRAIVRPELLSAPRPDPNLIGERTDLRVQIAVPGACAGFGAIAAALFGAFVWSSVTTERDAMEAAQTQAERVLEVARGGTEEGLGNLLTKRPGFTLVRHGHVYGTPLDPIPQGDGLIDLGGDGHPDIFIATDGDTRVVAPIPTPGSMPRDLLSFGLLGAFFICLAAVVLASIDAARDVQRATMQVRAVRSGDGPTPAAESSFATAELRQLVLSVDRLVSRIAETNVAQYVAIEKAHEADRLKSQFLANMSHDLRSPLNSILGFSELMLAGIEGELGPDNTEVMQLIQRSGRSLLHQIDDILDTAKLEAGRMEMHGEPTPPATLVSKAIHAARERATDKEIEFQTDIAAGLPPAFIDPYRTVQAITNVLLFACERMDSGTLEIRVRPGRDERGRNVTLSVFTPQKPATSEQLTQVLRGFVRIPGHQGLGLGLPIAGSILELQQGSLGIEDYGDGMIFTLRLPAPEARRIMRNAEPDELKR